MKGLSTTIIIVVTAVVILVAALVILTIFGGGIQNVATISQGSTMCIAEGQISGCSSATMWNQPVTWNAATKRLPDGTIKSCSELAECTCTSNLPTCKAKA